MQIQPEFSEVPSFSSNPHNPHHAPRRDLDAAQHHAFVVADDHCRAGEGFHVIVVVDQVAGREAGLDFLGFEARVIGSAAIGFARLDPFDEDGAAEAGGAGLARAARVQVVGPAHRAAPRPSAPGMRLEVAAAGKALSKA